MKIRMIVLFGLLLPLYPVSAQEEPVVLTPVEATDSAESVRLSATPEDKATPEDEIVPGEAFVNANTAYEAGNFEPAKELYEKLLAAGFENGRLHYNLGNAYLRNGELGRAIASYRRGQIFLPRDQDIAANLAFARKSTKDALAPPGPSAVERTLFFWHYALSRAELGQALVVLNLLLWLLLLLRIYRRGSEVLRWTFFVILILVLTAGGSFAIHHFMPQEVAVIVPQEIDVRSGTNVKDVVLFKLHAGTEVRVVDERESSIRIALPEEGRGGWIEAQHAEIVQ